MPSRVIAHIDMDAFFAAVEQRDNPSLKGKPVVIGADPKGGKGRGVVSTCSYEARPFGIHSAMPISHAYKRCPQAVFLRGNHQKYSDVSRQIRAILEDFTPDIQPISIDEAFLDITGCRNLFPSPLDMGRAIKERIKSELDLNSSIGIAPVKFVAKIASDFSKPDGLLVIKRSEVIRFLDPLPIERLWGVGKKTQSALNKMGIRIIGDIARFSLEDLLRHFGEHGAHLFNLANGIDPRPVEVSREVKSVSHEHTFGEDESDPDTVRATLLRLSEKVSRRLRKHELKGRTVSIKIRTKGFHTFTRAQTLSGRVDLIDDIYSCAKKLFEEFYQTGQLIRLIGVRVSNFEDAFVRDSLFEDDEQVMRTKVQDAMDLIKDKFGEKSIHRGN